MHGLRRWAAKNTPPCRVNAVSIWPRAISCISRRRVAVVGERRRSTEAHRSGEISVWMLSLGNLIKNRCGNSMNKHNGGTSDFRLLAATAGIVLPLRHSPPLPNWKKKHCQRPDGKSTAEPIHPLQSPRKPREHCKPATQEMLAPDVHGTAGQFAGAFPALPQYIRAGCPHYAQQ